jgi:hypothetical protein
MVHRQSGILSLHNEGQTMLTRRFTIICLIATLFAMAIVSLLNNTTRPAYALQIDFSTPCIYQAPHSCRAQ